MRVAVISDIHGNYHALEAVLAEVTAEAPDEIWCLGDVVGYGPEPNRCCEAVQERADLCLAGNHDLAVIGALSVEDFNGDAAAAVRWTQRVLTPEARSFLEPLVPAATRNGAALFHGSPVDPVWDYVLSEEGARLSLETVKAPLVMVGHSHVALRIAYDAAGSLSGGLAQVGDEVSLSDSRWLLNPGSVGQPRGGDPRAAWLMLDFDADRGWFRRTSYPIEKTQAEIRAAGLPDGLATRLGFGQ
jgi:predicted phosphodiesterase